MLSRAAESSSSAGAATSTRACPVYRLLPAEPDACEPWMASARLGAHSGLVGVDEVRGAPGAGTGNWTLPTLELGASKGSCPASSLQPADSGDCESGTMVADPKTAPRPEGRQWTTPYTEVPQWDALERHRAVLSGVLPAISWMGAATNSLVGYQHHSFRFKDEGWFGPNTVNGGADKASHLADYYVIASLFEDAYKMLGWSDNAAILWGFGIAVTTGFVNELSDGFTGYGFSPQDFAMDSAGAFAASLVSFTRTRDLFSIRTSHVPGPTYSNDVYSADLKLSGVGDRAGVKLGPLRWLLISVTYGTKGYRDQPPETHQRQLGFEIGLNLQQILLDLGVKRSSWWGYPLLFVAESIRFPYTAVGMRVDLNRGKWHGPNTGNYD